jgi:hypothetical protein
MRIAVSAISIAALSLLAAACELQPPPPKSAAAPTPPTPAPTPAPEGGSGSQAAPTPTPPVQPEAAPVDAGVRQKIEITPRCLQVAKHVAGVIIAAAEPGQRSVFEAERDRIERRNGEVCTIQAWSEAAMSCFLAASTQAAIKACEAKFPPPQQPPRPPATGAGSAAAPAAPVRGPDGKLPEPGTPAPSVAPPANTGSAVPPARPARPPANAGSAAAPARPRGGGLMPPAAGSGAR